MVTASSFPLRVLVATNVFIMQIRTVAIIVLYHTVTQNHIPSDFVKEISTLIATTYGLLGEASALSLIDINSQHLTMTVYTHIVPLPP